MLSDQSYKKVVKGLLKQEQGAIVELYDHYGSSLYGVILTIVSSDDVAQEILQDTFLKIWQKGYTYDPQQARLYTWMHRIARNLAINYIKSKANKKRKATTSNLDFTEMGDRSYKSETVDIKQHVLSLDTKYKEVIELVYLNGYTHKEASEKLALPLGTVKTRIKIGLRNLKAIYDFTRLDGITALFIISISMF